MSDVFDSLSDAKELTGVAIALLSANPTTISTEIIAHSSADLITSETACAIAGNITIIARAILHGSTNPYLVYLSQLRVSSRRTMRESLEKIARMVSEGDLDALNFPWSELRYQHTQAIGIHLLENRAPSTANKMMAALGRVLKKLGSWGRCPQKTTTLAVAIDDERDSAYSKAERHRAYELGAILSVCCSNKSIKESRDTALIAVLYGALHAPKRSRSFRKR